MQPQYQAFVDAAWQEIEPTADKVADADAGASEGGAEDADSAADDTTTSDADGAHKDASNDDTPASGSKQ